MAVLPVQTVMGHSQLADVSFAAKGKRRIYRERFLSVSEQIHLGKSQTSRKYQGEHYIAYFQAFTNTYAPVDRLRALYEEAITAPEIVALSIGTRPDCITPEILDLLEELNKRKPVFIEMGLQTSHDSTASF